jgi:hypothetical protein
MFVVKFSISKKVYLVMKITPIQPGMLEQWNIGMMG